MTVPTQADFVRFVVERQRVYLKKTHNRPKPWTRDPILQSYRFCNVYREQDTVTRWLRSNWSTRLSGDPDFWLSMVVGRLINWPATLEALERTVLPFNASRFVDKLEELQRHGPQPTFGPAYIVSTNGHTMPKGRYLADRVLQPLWDNRRVYRPTKVDTLASYHQRLTGANGMGSFMAAQVVADIKNTEGQTLRNAVDWWTWASPGPGSLRGMNRLLGKGPVRTGLNDARFREVLGVLQGQVATAFRERDWVPLCAQDVQNCLCEFDKYQRALLSEGTPKQKYPGM